MNVRTIVLVFLILCALTCQANCIHINPIWKYNTGNYIISSISISPDGKYVIASNRCFMFFLKDGMPLWTHRTGGYVKSVAVSKDGRYVVAGGWGIYVFDKHKNLVWKYKFNGVVSSVAISADGKYTVAGFNNYVYLFKDGKLMWKFYTSGFVSSVAIDKNGSYVVACTLNGHVYFFDVHGNLLWKRKVAGNVYSVSISSNGDYVAVGGNMYKLFVFDKNGKLLWKSNTPGCVDSVAISDKYVVAGVYNCNCIYLFNIKGKLILEKELATFNKSVNNNFTSVYYPVYVSMSKNYIAVGYNRTICVFDVSKLRLQPFTLVSTTQKPVQKQLTAQKNVQKINRYNLTQKFLKENKLNKLKINVKILKIYKIKGSWIKSLSISQKGYTSAGDNIGNIYFFDRNGNLLWSFKLSNKPVLTAISSDGRYVVGCYANNVCVFYDGKLLWKYKTEDDITSVVISPNDTNIILGDDGGRIYFFSKNGKLLWEKTIYSTYNGILAKNGITSIVSSSNGKYIAISNGYSLFVYNKYGKELWNRNKVYSIVLAISLDGNYIIAGSFNGSVYFFDSSGNLLNTYKFITMITDISINGNYVAISCLGYVALFKSGKLLWFHRFGVVKSISVCNYSGKALLAIGNYTGNVFLIDEAGNTVWKYNTKNFTNNIKTNGKLIVFSSGNKIYFVSVSKQGNKQSISVFYNWIKEKILVIVELTKWLKEKIFNILKI